MMGVFSLMLNFMLSPLLAVIILIIACFSGFEYRRAWVREGPIWKYWVYGSLAALGLLILGFVPLDVSP